MLASRGSVIEHAEGRVNVEPTANGYSRVSLVPNDPSVYIPAIDCETAFSQDVIRIFLASAGFPWLCDLLQRHSDDGYVMQALRSQMLAYFSPEDFAGKRILDFGCGSGGSTLGMAAMLPHTEFVGVELLPDHVELARLLMNQRGLRNVDFLASPDGNHLPADIGKFDFVMLSAVFEHLLPQERRTVLPLIWSHMKPGASLFINQTPYRWFPYEHHSTELWGINYLPDGMAKWAAESFSKAVKRKMTWEEHLRGGLRGATEWEVLRCLPKGAEVLQPRSGDRAAYWRSSVGSSHPQLKSAIASFFRVCDRTLGTVPSMNLDMVVRKIS